MSYQRTADGRVDTVTVVRHVGVLPAAPYAQRSGLSPCRPLGTSHIGARGASITLHIKHYAARQGAGSRRSPASCPEPTVCAPERATAFSFPGTPSHPNRGTTPRYYEGHVRRPRNFYRKDLLAPHVEVHAGDSALGLAEGEPCHPPAGCQVRFKRGASRRPCTVTPAPTPPDHRADDNRLGQHATRNT